VTFLVLRRAVLSFTLLATALSGAAIATLATPQARGQAGPPTATSPSTATTATTATTTVRTPTVAGPPVPATEGTSNSPTTLVISGRGWGHGVGLGQWGMFGFAKRGWTYARILAHYYRGTTLERRPPVIVGVLLMEEGRQAELASASPWTVVDGNGKKVALPAGSLKLGVRLAVAGRALASPLTFSPGGSALSIDGKPYRGQLRVFSNRKRLQVVNALRLEDYLKGVVPAEVPDDWPAEALKAQAVAARSYALANLPAPSASRVFDLYSDVRDQVYGGIEAEAPAVTRAVQATARQVLVHGGKVVTAYYSSTTGGRTASATEWLGNSVPYLVSVSDPYDTHSPYHTWGPVLFDARKVGKALGLKGALVDLVATRGDSGRVRELTAVGVGTEVTVRGTDVRTLLGLRSTWFTIGWLALDPPARAVYGAPTRLTGTARGLEGAIVLEGCALGGVWQELESVRPGADGSFELTVRPRASMEYRLSAAGVRGALVRVPVQPVVKATVVSRSVEGTLSPPLRGAAVEVQRQAGGGWATVAKATAGAGGAFSFGKRLAPGSYRVVCVPGKGLVQGVSRMLAVS